VSRTRLTRTCWWGLRYPVLVGIADGLCSAASRSCDSCVCSNQPRVVPRSESRRGSTIRTSALHSRSSWLQSLPRILRLCRHALAARLAARQEPQGRPRRFFRPSLISGEVGCRVHWAHALSSEDMPGDREAQKTESAPAPPAPPAPAPDQTESAPAPPAPPAPEPDKGSTPDGPKE
jgi:hypothetical protein